MGYVLPARPAGTGIGAVRGGQKEPLYREVNTLARNFALVDADFRNEIVSIAS